MFLLCLRHERKKRHPKTPPKNLKYTRRAWDGLIKNWRVKLYLWDPDRKHDDDNAVTMYHFIDLGPSCSNNS